MPRDSGPYNGSKKSQELKLSRIFIPYAQQTNQGFGHCSSPFPKVSPKKNMYFSKQQMSWEVNVTLSKTNIFPENKPPQKESSLLTTNFQGICWLQVG